MEENEDRLKSQKRIPIFSHLQSHRWNGNSIDSFWLHTKSRSQPVEDNVKSGLGWTVTLRLLQDVTDGKLDPREMNAYDALRLLAAC